MIETAKERLYREALVVLCGMGIKSNNKVMMPNGVAITAQEYLKEKLKYGENLPGTTNKLSVEKLQEIRTEELKDFNTTILQAELENQKLQKQLDSCIQTLIEASAAATITQDIVVGNLVDRKIADLAKTHKLAVDYIEKVTGKNIDVVLAENAALEAEEEE